ncbi:MAG: hypothetical protein IKI20_01935 [Lachnospiraceae bacterium]|nr:hypothetical protein [Lachnospiraceae bacterium]
MKEVGRSTIKWVAIVTMLIDHIRFTLIPTSPQWAGILNTAFSCIGRIAFPLFAYLLADGFLRTRSRQNYFLRLLIFAFVSEVPYDMMRDGKYLSFSHQNVIFTLLISFAAMWVVSLFREMEFFKERKNLRFFCEAAVCILAIVAAHYSHSDYGYIGVMTVLICFYGMLIAKDNPAIAVFRPDLIAFAGGVCMLTALDETEIVALTGGFLIWAYHGKTGVKVPKVVSYGFYPLHMLLLVMLRIWIYHMPIK